ncbi:MAG: twin-arginine translocase subunit TatC [Lentimicrobiaceae bacterium]|jgi:sec-independent protein translocase protein TatC|nr:twin-arginine translocase subunit TatC [Lentimicrobiaceae bacterium]MCP4910629.1 twin-arginine translocase subunit TatC [Bacteroidota bacterium]MBT3454862.1 twin-arginine translocase subunit TatC [Lentimicrobiaceae bacterium]MBT3818512.1 twin-arginine translocase subunit TatC [Lentimicrobiaceae bacterium]MBT4060879.1 twin-arginine translocase subunit TatC [Lentimicrobiaceae bacterium]
MEELKNKKGTGKKEKVMTFWDHLDELRWHIMRSLIAIVIFAIIAFVNRRIIFDVIILAPSTSDFITNRALCELGKFLSLNALCIKDLSLKIINIKMSGQFLTHMYISIVSGFILAFPYVLWEIWQFVKPAMKDNERKYSSGGVFISSVLFLMGILFSYFLIVPLTVNFLGTYHVSESVYNQISLSSYINTVVSVTFAVGLVFELPILVYFLTKIGVLTPDFMKKNRKYMYVIMLIVSAIITPPDMFSQILVVFPLIGLYEFSIGVSNRIYKKNLEELS